MNQATEKIEDALGIPNHPTKAEKFVTGLMHFFLYCIIFIGGFIAAKIQTLISGLG